MITGRTMVWVRASSQTAPTRNAATPTSSRAIRPRSRTHRGAAKIPASSPGSISTYSRLLATLVTASLLVTAALLTP